MMYYLCVVVLLELTCVGGPYFVEAECDQAGIHLAALIGEEQVNERHVMIGCVTVPIVFPGPPEKDNS